MAIFAEGLCSWTDAGNGASLAAYWRWCLSTAWWILLGLAAVIPVIGLVVEPELMALQCRIGAIYDFAYATACFAKNVS